MFKNKLKELVQNKKELTKPSFEVLSDNQSSMLIGGCRVLKSCKSFDGTCPNLTVCGTYREPQIMDSIE
jgi:hypothetical protein